jgi:beta-galactosidase
VSHTDPPSHSARIRFGAAYYPEYEPVARLDTDLDLMAAAGFTLIRVGESVWSTWEPRDGEFDLEWLAPVLDGARRRGIDVILGTPTYAVPPWLMAAHPEIAAEKATGVRVPWGARQEADTSHPVFRRYAERIVRAVTARHAGHPAVVGVQIDNEPGLHLCHNDHVFADFKAWLLARHGDVDAINRRWNLAHWAHRLNHIDELWRPDGNHVPQYDLAWRRFHAQRTTDYIAWQTAIVREYLRPGQFTTTCVARLCPAADDRSLGRAVDLPAANLYVATQDQLSHTADGQPEFPPSGAGAPFAAADRAWAMADGPFLVTETNATSVGFPWFNYPAYDGQWRQTAWAFIARGARSLGYWHWHSMHGSWEAFWTGLLPHSFEPGRVYREIAALGADLKAAGAALADLAPDARLGFVVSNPSRWAWEFHPPLQDPAADPVKQGPPDRLAYERVVHRVYGGLHRAGHQLRVLHADALADIDPARLAADLPCLVVMGLYAADDDLPARLKAYVAAGGHLVLGCRALYADADGCPRLDRQPAGLADLAGASHAEFSNLAQPLRVTGRLAGHAEGLLEALEPAGAEPLATPDHPHFRRWPTVTTRSAGAGRVTYVATLPDLALGESLGHWIAEVTPATAIAAPVQGGLPAGVTRCSAVNGQGQRVWFYFNFGADPAALAFTPGALRDALTGAPADTAELGPWDVRVFKETP